MLTPKLGKITILAKGALNIKSSRLSSLQLGNTIKAHIYQKNGKYWLSESQTLSGLLLSPKTLTQYNLIFYSLELVNQLIAENQHLEHIYQLAQSMIDSINHNRLIALIRSEINLLRQLGFGLPQAIVNTFQSGNFVACQHLLKQHIESILEKPLESNKLFR